MTTLMMTRKYVTRPNRMVDIKVPAGIGCFHVRAISGFAELPPLNKESSLVKLQHWTWRSLLKV